MTFMGASGWHYAVPYNDDPEAALQELRHDVFASGDYGVSRQFRGMWPLFWRMRGPAKFVVLAIFIAAKTFFTIDSAIRWLARGCRRPRSIEEAVELAAEAGTHSILDIQSCGQTPDFGLAVPLSAARMRRLFGTDQPTAKDLEQILSVAGEDLERWHCICFPLYEDGKPTKLIFVGCSGD